MSDLEKILTAIVGIALITTLILPGRQTPAVIDSASKGFSRVLGKAMGTS